MKEGRPQGITKREEISSTQNHLVRLPFAPLQISRPQNLHVMRLMPRHNVGQRPDAHLVVARNASPEPRLSIERAKQEKICPAHMLELVCQIIQLTAIEIRSPDVIILLKTWKRRLVVSSEAEGTMPEDALAIYHMSDQLPDAPLAGRIARCCLSLRESAQGG
jgi:hypothetical protein